MARKAREIKTGKPPFDDGDMAYQPNDKPLASWKNTLEAESHKLMFYSEETWFGLRGDAADRVEDMLETKPGAMTDEDDDGMAYQLYGEAVAIGEDTFAAVSSFSHMFGSGAKTIAKGYVRAQAAAESENDDSTFADAYTDVTVNGADLTIIWNKDESAQINGISVDLSFTKFYAVDFARWNGNATLTFDEENHIDIDGKIGWRAQRFLEKKFGNIFDLDGNIATADVEATVEAENSFVDVAVNVLAIEDDLSEATASITAAGSDII